jgi:hypothetical protein
MAPALSLTGTSRVRIHHLASREAFCVAGCTIF